MRQKIDARPIPTTANLGVWLAIISLLIYAAGCNSTASTKDKGNVTVELANLEPGHWVEADWNRLPVIIYHRTERDIANLKTLQDVVFENNKEEALGPLRSKNPNYFVAIMVSPHSACKVRLVPIGEKQLSEGKVWLGGFICPCREIPYDLAGRTIKPGQYNSSGWSAPTPYLKLPPYYFEGTKIVIGNAVKNESR